MTTDERKGLHDALLSAFPSKSVLSQMTFIHLGQSLDVVADGTNLSQVAFRLIEWAETQGRIEELVAAAKKANPNNPTLRAFTLGGAVSPPRQQDTVWAWRPRRSYLLGFLGICALASALVFVIFRVPKPVQQVTVAQEFVDAVHLRDFNVAYDMWPAELRKNITLAQFQADAARTLFQVPARPIRSTVEQVLEQGGNFYVILTSEFGVDAKTREIVGFVKTNDNWKLWAYSWQPIEWPLFWPTSTQIEPSALGVMMSYATLSSQEQSAVLPARFQGRITGANPGWKVVVDSRLDQRGEHRCSIRTRESGTNVIVELKLVIGGCSLKSGQRILVQGLLSAVNGSRLELEGVRYFPEG